jgi:hypothetical protein
MTENVPARETTTASSTTTAAMASIMAKLIVTKQH